MFRVVLFCLAGIGAAFPQTVQDLQQAVSLHQSGNYKAAIDGYQLFLKSHPEVSGVRSNLGAALAHEGRFEEAIREYTLALAADSKNPAIHLNLALSYFKSGDTLRAIEHFEAAHAANPADRQTTVLLATSYLRLGQHKKVIELLEPITDINDKDLAVSTSWVPPSSATIRLSAASPARPHPARWRFG